MIRFGCPHCKAVLKAQDHQAHAKFACPTCGQRLQVPPPGEAPSEASVGEILPDDEVAQPASPSSRTSVAAPPNSGRKQADEKHCVECGRAIRARAELCPHCGVSQPSLEKKEKPNLPPRSSVKTPLLISAIFNIIAGLLWALTCIGIVFTFFMIILCIFEFVLFFGADTMPRSALARWAKIIGIFEIFIGLANLPTLICGIIVLVNAGKLTERLED